MTTSAVAQQAHVSPGTFYRYFNDKDELLQTLRDDAVEAISTDLMVGVVDVLEADVEAGLRRVVTTLIEGFEQHRGVLQAIVSQAPAGTNADLMPEIESNLRQLASVLPRRHRPDLSPEQLEEVVFVMIGVLVSTSMRIVLHAPATAQRTELIDLTVAMLVAGLGAAGTTTE